jgi:uncharacterized protein YfbU (UPF0304 family)/uncharacterized protein YbaR (Trm112 family)
MMDTEDESTQYLKLFNDGPHNYLLHSNEDGLNDAFPVESIFTEIASDWSSEGFPILLSGPLIADENNDSESTSANVQLLSEENDSSRQNDDSRDESTVTFFSNADKNRLILANDVLLKVATDDNDSQENTVTHMINGDAYSITYTQESPVEVAETEENVEVIQLLNIDGTITTIDKNALNTLNGKEKTNNFENFFTQVEAYKCKFCSFLCESVEEVTTHISLEHAKEVQQSKANGDTGNGELVGTKMTSVLNMNKDKKKYTLYLCSDCSSGYSNKEDLKQHMINQHKMVHVLSSSPGTNELIASDKSKSTENEQKRLTKITSTSLVKKQKAMRKVKCSIKGCPLRFDKEESRKRHEDCHVDQNKKQFMCPVCKTKFSIWRICSMHMWKCHSIDLGLLTCPMCNQFKSYSAGNTRERTKFIFSAFLSTLQR